MANDDKSTNDQDPKFSFGVRELKRAQTAHTPTVQNLSVKATPRKAVDDAPGFDPYNSSGSFDRTKHWSRVTKR